MKIISSLDVPDHSLSLRLSTYYLDEGKTWLPNIRFAPPIFHSTISLTQSRNPVNGRSFLPSHQIQATGFTRSNKPLNTFSMKTLHTHEQRPARIYSVRKDRSKKMLMRKFKMDFLHLHLSIIKHNSWAYLTCVQRRTHTYLFALLFRLFCNIFTVRAKRVVSTAQHIAVYRFLFVRL